MDVPLDIRSEIAFLKRRCESLEMALSQHFSRREPSLGRYLQTRLAMTCNDPDVTPQYPASASTGSQFNPNTFPVRFLDSDFLPTSGLQTPHYGYRSEKPQTRVHSISNDYIPVGRVIPVFQLRGTDASYPGEWWTGQRMGVFIGKTNAAIAMEASGMVSRYRGSYGTETDTGEDDLVKNRFGNVASGRWVAYECIDGVFYLITAQCRAGSSGGS